jgi:hypothetical protein
MTLDEKQLFITKIIATGIEAEYDISEARQIANMTDFRMP